MAAMLAPLATILVLGSKVANHMVDAVAKVQELLADPFEWARFR